MAQEFMHKNKLQEYAQRCASALPIYHTVNEGSPHAPMFRSSVTVDGAIFTLPLSFSNKKAAEQNIAKYALDCIISNIKNNGVPLIHHDTVFCKSVLHEYAVKMNLKMPTYETSPQPGIIPIFVSSVTFDDKTFKGGFAKSKKEAEQIGARTVIEFILENSDTRTVMSQIIKSKGRLYDTMGKGVTASSSLVRSTITFVPNIADTSEKGTQMQVPSNCNVSPDVTSLRPFSAEPNTTVTDSITAEAMREQINKQTSDLISVNTLQTLPQVVGAGGSVNGVSGNDSAAFHIQHPVAAFHIQHPVEVKVEILSNDSGSPCGDSQNLVSGTSKKRSGKRKKSNSKMKKARVETKSQAE